jgi:5-aminopentanamidase
MIRYSQSNLIREDRRMATWKIAAVQMDARLAGREHNLQRIRAHLRNCAGQGVRLVVYPECILSGYGFASKEEAWPHAEPVPGPSTQALLADCRQLGVWAIVGMLEQAEQGRLFNTCVLLGPDGQVITYRKVHLPCLGVDRFTTPGDRPFAVHDLGGLRVGMNICYDGSFPEPARILALLGADLVVLPTNWPDAARRVVQFLVQARAFENAVYYAGVNRVGVEAGFHFLGLSRIVDPTGDLLAASDNDREEVLLAEIDPERARRKRVVIVPGEYEVDRVGDRRPEMYGPLCAENRPAGVRR